MFSKICTAISICSSAILILQSFSSNIQICGLSFCCCPYCAKQMQHNEKNNVKSAKAKIERSTKTLLIMYNTANTVLARGQNKTHPCILNTKLILLMLYNRRVQKLDCFAVSLVCSSFLSWSNPIQVKKRIEKKR